MINERLTASIYGMLRESSIRLPKDVQWKLDGLALREDSALGKELYGCIAENLKKAEELSRPICQDTGALQFFVKAGARFKYLSDVEDSIREAVRRATVDVPLRPNIIETFDEKNTGNNIGTRAPWIEWEIDSSSDALTVEVYMAGGGCSLPGCAKVLMPLEGMEGVVKFVLDAAVERGINACPPLIVGVGIGTCAPTAAMLSKKALLRELGSHNPHSKARELEKLLFDGLNNIGIGPLGMTGRESVLGVNVEYAAHHPAAVGVGVSFGCWATRRGKIVYKEGLST